MKKEDLYRALGEIDEELIEEARIEKIRSRRPAWIPAVMAAAAVIVVGMTGNYVWKQYSVGMLENEGTTLVQSGQNYTHTQKIGAESDKIVNEEPETGGNEEYQATGNPVVVVPMENMVEGALGENEASGEAVIVEDDWDSAAQTDLYENAEQQEQGLTEADGKNPEAEESSEAVLLSGSDEDSGQGDGYSQEEKGILQQGNSDLGEENSIYSDTDASQETVPMSDDNSSYEEADDLSEGSSPSERADGLSEGESLSEGADGLSEGESLSEGADGLSEGGSSSEQAVSSPDDSGLTGQRAEDEAVNQNMEASAEENTSDSEDSSSERNKDISDEALEIEEKLKGTSILFCEKTYQFKSMIQKTEIGSCMGSVQIELEGEKREVQVYCMADDDTQQKIAVQIGENYYLYLQNGN